MTPAALMQHSIGGNMGPGQVSETITALIQARFQERRPFAVDISLHHVVCRLVDREPVLHFGPEMLDDYAA